MRISTLLMALVGAVLPFFVQGQPKFYQHDTTVKVYAYGKEKTLAWCGGFNGAQFTMGDLNKDGKADLVVFEPWSSLRTFINVGAVDSPAFKYAPEYAINFPPIYDYVILADYNCDGVPDLFQQGFYGCTVYRGYYNSNNQLCFAYFKDLFVYNDLYAGGGPENVFNNPGDIPCVVDIDNDGDLDFVSYNIGGGYMNLYKNMQAELRMPCDSMPFALKDRCWGKVYQGYYRTHSLGAVCDNTHLLDHKSSGGKVAHSGNTPCLFDWDMDGDFDYLDGSVSFNEMTFLKNGRNELGSGPDSMIWQDTMWQTGGKQIELPMWPAAFNIDVDQDGKNDLIISPNLQKYENYKVAWYYKNYTTPGAPDWRFQSDTFLVDKSIDLGSDAYPMYFDYDKDGKPDLFIGSDGYYQSATGLLRSRMHYYKNTSTVGHPSFTLVSEDFLGLNAINYRGIAPAFGDIDNDGKADMILGHFNGTLSYFKNMATSDTAQPDWQLMEMKVVDASGDTINTDGSSAPFIYDIDKDGKNDLIIGNYDGTLIYYQNVSTTPGVLALKLVSDHLGNIKADPKSSFGNFSTPFIGKIDSTGIDYLLMGSSSGLIYRFTGFQTGDTTATYTMLDSAYSYIDTMYNQYLNPGTFYDIYSGLRSSVTVADITGDGNYHMIIGNVKGGVEDYRNKVYIPPPPVDHTKLPGVPENGTVSVYPNPASDVLNIAWADTPDNVAISLVNMEGQTILHVAVQSGANKTSLNTSELPSGMYVCILQQGVRKYYSKVTLVR